jgi:membrane-bound lytic murein transglycosylase B
VTEKEQRQHAARKAREEIRNAVRAEMVAQGFSREKLERAMTDIATHVAKKMVSSKRVEKIIDDTVEKAIAQAKLDVANLTPNFNSISERIERQVGVEIAQLAKERVRECVEITFTKGIKQYSEGGTF